VLKFIKRLSKPISSYLSSRNILEVNFTILNLILNIVVVDIIILYTFIITCRDNRLKERLVITKKYK
jgi:hypothetical protein